MNATNPTKEIVWWVDHLGLREARAIFWQTRKSQYILKELRYFGSVSWPAHAFCYCFIPFVKEKKIIKADLELAERRSPQDGILFWKACHEYNRFGWNVGRKSKADEFLVNAVDPSYEKEVLRLYLRRQISYEHFRNMKIINVVDQCAGDMKETRHALLLDGGLWDEYFKEYKFLNNVSMYTYNSKNYVILTFIRLGYIFIKALKNFSLWLVRSQKQKNDKKAPVVRHPAPRIGIFYAQGVDPTKRDDLFWLAGSGIDSKDVVVYFFDPHKPLTPEIVGRLKDRGVGYVSILPEKLNKDVPLEPSAEYHGLLSRSYFKNIFAGLRLLTKMTKEGRDIQWWQLERLIWLFDRISILESLFRSQNIKVHFGFYAEDDQNIIAQHLALKRSGGADTFVIWSNLPGAEIMPAHDIYFCWGPHYLYCIEDIGHGIKNLLYSGYPFDYQFDAVSEKANQHRKNMEQRGVRYIITLFDNVYYEGGWFLKDDLILFHEIILSEVKKNKDMGVILKPKRAESFSYAFQGEVKRLIEELSEEGRCLVFKTGELPAEAAMASDLSIGFGVFNSAAVESALAGVTTILYDPVNQKFDPFYRYGFEKIVFNDLNRMMKAIREYRADPRTNRSFGDFSKYLPQIDPFRDRKANQRIGSVIRSLIESFKDGVPREAAINKAVKEYQERYGSQSIVNLTGPDNKSFLEKVTV